MKKKNSVVLIAAMLVVAGLVLADEQALDANQKIQMEWEKQDTVSKFDLILGTIPTNNLGGATNEIAEVRKLLIQTKMDLEEARSFENSITKVKLGYVSFAPYVISEDPNNAGTYLIGEGSSSGSAFLEVAFADRYAWRTDSKRKTGMDWRLGTEAWRKRDIRRPWDWEAKLGFILGGGTSDDEITGSTIAAGGDMYGEVAAGYPLFYAQQDKKLQVSAGPEVVATLVTEKSNFDIHGNYKAVIAFVAGGANTVDKRSWQMLTRIGVGWVDIPQLEGTNSEVKTDGNGHPKFNHEFGTYTQIQFDLPVMETSTVSLSGEFWNGLDINPWSTYVSYSVSFTGIKNFLNFN